MVQTKNKLFETDLGNTELLVSYIEKVKRHPSRKEFCHGEHEFNEDDVEITLLFVEIVIPQGQSIDILPNLSEKQKQYIIDNLD